MNYGVLTITFLGVNLDFFFMLIFLLNKYDLTKVMVGYLLGNWLLLTLSFFIGKALLVFLPEWILGVLGFLPIYLALKRDEESDNVPRGSGSQIWQVLLTYLAVCSGCNLSIFLPVLVGESGTHFLMTLLFIGLLTLIVVLLIKLVANVRIVSTVMTGYGDKLMKACYVMIGLYVFWDSGLVSHLVGLI